MPMNTEYTCLVVDDDEIDRLTTVSYLRKYPALRIAGVYESAESALEAAPGLAPDILFPDIDMPGINGLQLREKLMHIPACVFITSFPDYAVESFELAAFDFLVKPLRADRLALTVQRLEEYLRIRHKSELFDYALGGDVVYIKDGHEQVKIALHDIYYLEALKDYTAIVTSKRKYTVLSTLGNLLALKGFSSFIRIHRSYAVQKNYVDRVSSRELQVGTSVLPIGRTYRDAVNSIFNNA